MLASLHPSLRYMQLDAFISDCVSVAAKHHGNPSASNRSFRGYSPASRLCNSTLEHLLDRKTSRMITRRGQMPCYTVPGVGSWSPFIDLLPCILPIPLRLIRLKYTRVDLHNPYLQFMCCNCRMKQSPRCCKCCSHTN